MTPWLRLTHHSLRLLVVLVAALPAYGAATAYAGPGTTHSSTPTAPSPSPPSSPSPSGHAGSSGDPARPAHDHQDGPGHEPGHEHDGPAAGDPPRPTHAPRPPTSSNHPPSGEPSRAGSGAGEGRMRPGRADGPWAEVEGDDDPVGSAAAEPAEPETAEPPTSAVSPRDAGLDPTGTPRDAARQSEDASEPELRILPLGSGLVLIGLGLGLAFLGLRLRRG
ncbi:hypothetical protein [Streptomyces misionensis]|uniref:hypothetical protein n=1 Tax=Streptomyces misionensis TaxID=67331 RepID=UPI00369F6859